MSSSPTGRFKPKHARALRIALAMAIPAVVLFGFQNCGQSVGSSALVPPNSPFYAQRVYLGANEMAKAEPDAQNEIPVTLVVNNKCVKEMCGQPGAEKSIICPIADKHFVDELGGFVQAYDWSVGRDATESSVEQMLAANQADHDCVIGVTLRQEYKAVQAASNDPQRAYQYHHDVLQTDQAMAFFGNDLPRVRVGVVDTGLERTHEDLSPIPGDTDWTNFATSCPTALCNFHGTFVSGIIAAAKGNGKGGYGIAQNAQVRSVRVGNSQGTITTTEIYNALNWFNTADPVEIVNLSLGGSGVLDQSIQDAMVRLIDKDTLIVVAAGNNGQDLGEFPFYPASFNYDGQINVASASPAGIDGSKPPPYQIDGQSIVLDSYSNYNSGIVHIAAPGRAIYSTSLNNSYTTASGTSFSTPMVVGALAVLKGYLKSKGYTNPSASVLRQLLLDGSRTLPELTTKVNGGKYLNLMALKSTAEIFLATMNSSPTQISLISSETVVEGVKKLVKIKVEVVGGTPGQYLRAYTNKAFLEDSYTGLSCEITQARQFCEFKVNFDALYVDPGVYFTLSNSSGQLLADLNVPKTALNFGVRAESELIGEISSVIVRPNVAWPYFHAEGWACLKGFPDEIFIEVRKNSKTSTPIQYLKTVRQARGDFFKRCAAAEISFGFTFVLPTAHVSSSARYYFKAVHKGTGKTLEIPVTSYQPGYNDPKAPVYVDSVYYDATWLAEKPQIKITKREFKNFVVNIEGSVCNRVSKVQPFVHMHAITGDTKSLFPELWEKSTSTNSPALEVTEAANVQSEAYRWNVANPNYIPPAPGVGSISCSGFFSDITYPCGFGAPGLSEPIKLLQPLTRIPNEIYTSNGEPTAGSMAIQQESKRSEAFTFFPSLEMGDGCPHPSGFKVTYDISKFVPSFKMKTGMAWRSDMIDRETAKNRMGFEAALMQEQPNRSWDQLRFLTRVMNVSLVVEGGGVAIIVPDDQLLRKAVNETAPSTDWVLKSKSDSSYWEEYWVWKTSVSKELVASSQTALSVVYATPNITMKRTDVDRVYIALDYLNGSKFGKLGNDFRVEFALNGTNKWYEAQVDEIMGGGSNGIRNGTLAVSTDLPTIGATSIRFRILSNGKNQLKLNTFGITTP